MLSLVPKKTVDGVMSIFTKAVKDLALVQEQQSADAQRFAELAKSATASAQASQKEAERAQHLSSKLTEMFV